MPGIGSAAYEVNGYRIPDKYEAALQAGVRFFVLRYPRRTKINESMFGPFDVSASEMIDPQARGISWDIRWITGNDASVVYIVQPRSETAIAFMPDDFYYHNRMILCDHPELIVDGLYSTQTGMKTSSEIVTEIRCLREVVTEEVPIYKVVTPNGREVCFFWNYEEAKEQITLVETVMRNKMPIQEQRYIKCKIVEGSMRKKTKEIQNLILKYSRIPYGWTASDEFLKGVVPRVDELIKEHKKASAPEQASSINIESEVRRVLQGMSIEQLKALKNMQPPPMAPIERDEDDIVAEAPVQPTKQVSGSIIPQTETYMRYKLEKLKRDELHEIALGKGIPVDDNMTRLQLIDAIMASQEEEPVIV